MLNLDTNHSNIYIYKKKIIFSFVMAIDKTRCRCCTINFYASSCTRLYEVIGDKKFLFFSISLNHLLYIGKEIYKAELSQLFKQIYVQSQLGKYRVLRFFYQPHNKLIYYQIQIYLLSKIDYILSVLVIFINICLSIS